MDRTVRGIIVLVVFMPLLFFTGRAINPFVLDNGITAALFCLLLSLVIRQRKLWAAVVERTGMKDTASDKENYEEANRNISSVVLRFSDGLITNGILFLAGGFALLLPYRFLRVAIDDDPTAPKPSNPNSPFHRVFLILAELMALPGTLLSGIFLAGAHIFLPRTSLSAFRGLFTFRKNSRLSYTVPLNTLAYGLRFSLHEPFGVGKAGKQWLGPADGRAKLQGSDVRRTGLILVIAGLLAILSSLMALSLTLTP